MVKLNPRERIALEWLIVLADGFKEVSEALDTVTLNFNLSQAERGNVKAAYEHADTN
jgi:hypothetical protein